MKNVKKIFALIVAVACAFTSVISAKAIDATAKFTYDKALEQQYRFQGAGTTVKKAQLASGKTVYALCFNHAKEAPGINSTLYLVNNGNGKFANQSVSTATVLTSGQINSLKNRLAAYAYILDNGIQPDATWNDSLFTSVASSFTENEKYYATQLALWGVLYKDDTTNGVNIEGLTTTQTGASVSSNASLTKVKKAAIILRDKALSSSFTEPKIAISGGKSMYATTDKKYYRTIDFTVSGAGYTNYVVTLTNAPKGAEIVGVNSGVIKSGSKLNAGEKFYVRIPYSDVKSTTSGSVQVSATGVKRNVAVYAPVDQTRQNMIVDYSESKVVSAKADYSASEEKGGLEVTKVYTNAANVTTKLAGVKLQVLDKDNKVIEEWVTNKDNNPHTITNLKAGETYTIHEVSAPDTADFKYIKSPDIKVTIQAGVIIKKTVVNKGTTDVTISKQDATTGEELPGAKLELRNDTGTLIESWTSTNTPHVVVNKDRADGKLIPGKYCLKETIAPEGYQLSTEEVCFMVNNDGGVDEPVVMKNQPKTSIKISKQDITTKKELPGAKLTVKDEKGNVVDTWVSSTKPHYLTLPDGKYTLIEVTAPKGYGLSEEVITFEVKAGEAEKTVVMTNAPIPVTADMNITLIVGALIATVILVGFSLFKLNKQQEA